MVIQRLLILSCLRALSLDCFSRGAWPGWCLLVRLSLNATSWERPFLNTQSKIASPPTPLTLCDCSVLIFSLYLPKYLKLLYLRPLVVLQTTKYAITRTGRRRNLSVLFTSAPSGLRTVPDSKCDRLKRNRRDACCYFVSGCRMGIASWLINHVIRWLKV